MIPVDQEFTAGDLSGQPGDCLRAAVAAVLELPRDEVPHFLTVRADGDWLAALVEWASSRGYAVRWRDPAVWPVLEVTPGGVVIAVGKSPRAVHHAVVADAVSGELLHDPHPSRAGFTGPALAQLLLVPAPHADRSPS